MIQYPGFDPIAIAIGPVKVHWYGVMYLVGFATAWWLARYRAARPGSSWKPVDVDDFIFFGMLGVILGGRLGYVLFYGMKYWMEDGLYPLKIWDGGMSFHGGLLGVGVATAIFALRRGRHIADVFDFAAPVTGLGLLAGRVGNFINGELWGKPTEVPWGFRVDGEVRHATQLYEGALEGLVLFAVLWWFTSRPRPRFAPIGLFLALYGAARVVVEFWRIPDAHIGYLAGGWLTMGMVLSLPMVLAGLAMLAIAYRRNEPSGNCLPAGAVAAGRARAGSR
ncbi:MAG: prolipoprotein diacylglyceryl transferase [Steroidobacteraceae bacterium]|nr:prolipoprotein diacylglyceryl transferase [Nevskiaceae bacterium]MCP5339418.1 prolipoprotein diacylglyceryl transferase [Nevskiaceae bacterium]MCP5360528.1 prolipoprotein diacylglyceryl transferase [Nevskiaceae bacterium]MCP5472874.1 prolipoprotein diacylglyceryl transferase [Nevskiaceae bacterium]